MKKIFALVCVVLASAMVLAGCGQKEPESQIANPMADYNTVEEAEKAAGVDFPVPSAIPEGYAQQHVSLTDKTLLQVVYQKAENDRISYRAAKEGGAFGLDISGDYTEYAQEETLASDGTEVTARGADGGFSVAIWNSGGMDHALSFDVPADGDTVLSIIESVK